MVEDRLKKQIEFLSEIDKLKEVEREIYISSSSRKENSAEHSWHIALFTLLLAEHSFQKLDILKTIKMVLIHDIIEIDSGDIFAYNLEAREKIKNQEKKAAQRLFSLLPEDQALEFINLWNEFESQSTPESLFANAMDRFQPLILESLGEGKILKKHNISKSQSLDRHKNIEQASSQIYKLALNIINNFEKNGFFNNN